MPGVLQSCSESTTSNSPSSSKSSHAHSSDSDGDADSSPKEGKNKRKKAKADEPAQKKARKSKESNQNAFIELSSKILEMQNAQVEAIEQRSSCSRWKSSRGKSMKKAEEGIRNFSFAWQNF